MTTVFDSIRDRLSAFLGFTHQGLRDTYKQFGYPQTLTPEALWAQYLRNGIANRIVRAFPKATWRQPPTMWDEQGNSAEEDSDNYSEFTAAVAKLMNVHKGFTYLERADRISGIGRYGLLYMGFRDGLQPDKELLPGKHPLLYLSCYGEAATEVSQWDTDVTSPRYGMPTLYTVRTASLSSMTVSGAPTHKKSMVVHWTRVLHLAEFLDEDEVYGTPRLVPVYNWLQDLEKTAGASAETFWYNSRPGLAMSADKDANFSSDQITNMQAQATEYEHQLRRMLALQGIELTQLTSPVADPGPNIEKLLDLIAGTCEIPKRILIGSERGELSSAQDENNFAARVNERSTNYAGPYIMKPFVQRMIDTGNVPAPQGEWGMDWPSAGQTPEQAANVGLIRSNTLRNYITAPGSEVIVPPNEFRQHFLGLAPESEFEIPEERLLDEPEEEPAPQEGEQPDDDGAGAGEDEAPNASPQEQLDDEDDGDLLRARLRVAIASGEWRNRRGQVAWVHGRKSLHDLQRLALRVKHFFEPKTLYVCREVLNAQDILRWARREGFQSMLPAGELHVTIAYSMQPVDWMKIPTAWEQKEDGTLVVPPGGPRHVACLGTGDAVALLFNHSGLSYRHEDIKRCGATWKWASYQPHVTLTYEAGDMDLEDVTPYEGVIELGPERFKEIVEGWSDDVQEVAA